jgi:caa(3)-type oxidase subunit IV
MAGHSEEELKQFVRTCYLVFGTLMVLTVVTVGLSYMQWSVQTAIVVGLTVAAIKGSLVALYFMHLISEQRVIYWALGLTACFFFMVMTIPVSWYMDGVTTDSVWTVREPGLQPIAHDGDHGADQGEQGDGGHEEDSAH